jgi:hypothetical protein
MSVTFEQYAQWAPTSIPPPLLSSSLIHLDTPLVIPSTEPGSTDALKILAEGIT